jgi:hypothetical protein
MNAANVDLSLTVQGQGQRHSVELYSDSGLSLTIDDKTASIAFPIWYSGERIDSVLDEAKRYIAIIQREGPFVIYDPQAEGIYEVSDALNNIRQVLSQLPTPHDEEIQVIRLD